jgi:hypothetical protein
MALQANVGRSHSSVRLPDKNKRRPRHDRRARPDKRHVGILDLARPRPPRRPQRAFADTPEAADPPRHLKMQPLTVACDVGRLRLQRLGEHTREVVREVGYAEAEIDGLVEKRAVGVR